MITRISGEQTTTLRLFGTYYTLTYIHSIPEDKIIFVQSTISGYQI